MRPLALALFAASLTACSTLIPTPDIPREVATLDPLKAWGDVLAKYVDDMGRVDFESLAKDQAKLRLYVNYVSKHGPKTNPDKFKTKEAVLAHYINAYNALSMYNILDAGIPESLSGFTKVKFFYFRKFVIDNEEMSLYGYENDIIRKVGEERVHVALNCMSAGCPRLPRKPFTAAKLEDELRAEAIRFFNEERNVRLAPKEKEVHLSEILDFFTEDFLAKAPTLIDYVNRYRKEKIPADYEVEFIPYDWTVNRQPKPAPKVSEAFRLRGVARNTER